MRSHIGAPATGGPVNRENDSAVILKPSGKEFSGAVAEGIGDDDRRARVLPTDAVAGYRIGVGKAGRKGSLSGVSNGSLCNPPNKLRRSCHFLLCRQIIKA